MQDLQDKFYEEAFLLKDDGIDFGTIETAVEQILTAVGEDKDREGLLRTPHRVAKMYEELLAGYRVDPIAVINDAFYKVEYDEMVIVRDIEFYSLCEHHLLPFIGRAHVAYIPNGVVIGLSKIPRIVDMFARRLQLQERLTQQVANYIDKVLEPKGVAVVIESMHLCAMTRGVQKHDARMTTTKMLGEFKDNPDLKTEFLDNITRNHDSLHF
jgi:GTP cyclohydrolase I